MKEALGGFPPGTISDWDGVSKAGILLGFFFALQNTCVTSSSWQNRVAKYVDDGLKKKA